MYYVVLTKDALKDLQKLTSSNPSKKAKKIADSLAADPFSQSFEALKYDLSGMYSKRINIQHRLVYTVDKGSIEIDNTMYDGVIRILSMWSHYDKL